MKIETNDEKTIPITFEYDLKMQNAMKCNNWILHKSFLVDFFSFDHRWTMLKKCPLCNVMNSHDQFDHKFKLT